MERFVVVDGFNFVMIAASAAYMASKGRVEDGVDEDVLYNIVMKMCMSLKTRFAGYTGFFTCWDEKGGTQFRKDIYPDYKANRKSVGVISTEGIMKVAGFMEDTYGMKKVSIGETEGDDTMYALCKVLKETHNGCFITAVSRDKDIIQIVQKGAADEMFEPTKKEFVDIPWYPIVDYKCLVGDSSDNIHGVPKIGPKGAEKIMVQASLGKTIESQLKPEQFVEFDRCKDIVDMDRHPRLQENLQYIRTFVCGTK